MPVTVAIPFRFQSTLPVKGATRQAKSNLTAWTFQSTLPVKGATIVPYARYQYYGVSIHAPGEGSDSAR